MPEPRARPNQGGLAFGLEFGEQSEAAADGAELGAQIAGERPEANGDNGDDNAGDQGVFKCRNGPAIGCQSQPDFHLLNHVPAPILVALRKNERLSQQGMSYNRWTAQTLSAHIFI
jgi:hypothetical protein